MRELATAGYRVRALTHNNAVTRKKRMERSSLLDRPTDSVEYVEGDVTRAGDLAPALDGCRYLVHCAALYSFAPRDRAAIRHTNVTGTAAMLEAARIAGIERAVVTSSSATVAPANNGTPSNENSATTDAHGSTYHRSKVDQERVALAAQLPVVLLLPTAPVGPGDWKPTPTGRLVLDFVRGRMLARPDAGGLNLVAVEDVARAHVVALERGHDGERYLLGGENLSFDQVWERLAAAAGRRVPQLRVPHRLALAVGYVDELRCRVQPRSTPMVPLEGVRMSREYRWVDSAKAARELGYAASSVDDALARAVTWYRENGYV